MTSHTVYITNTTSGSNVCTSCAQRVPQSSQPAEEFCGPNTSRGQVATEAAPRPGLVANDRTSRVVRPQLHAAAERDADRVAHHEHPQRPGAVERRGGSSAAWRSVGQRRGRRASAATPWTMRPRRVRDRRGARARPSPMHTRTATAHTENDSREEPDRTDAAHGPVIVMTSTPGPSLLASRAVRCQLVDPVGFGERDSHGRAGRRDRAAARGGVRATRPASATSRARSPPRTLPSPATSSDEPAARQSARRTLEPVAPTLVVGAVPQRYGRRRHIDRPAARATYTDEVIGVHESACYQWYQRRSAPAAKNPMTHSASASTATEPQHLDRKAKTEQQRNDEQRQQDCHVVPPSSCIHRRTRRRPGRNP